VFSRYVFFALMAFIAGNGFARGTPASSSALQAPRVTVTTLAGIPLKAGALDGPKEIALLDDPHGVAVAADGTIYASEAGNHILRKIISTGKVMRLAGLPQQQGAIDGKGDAARFFLPNSMAIDRKGFLYVADLGNHAIRKISPEGIVTTFAGKLGALGDADGPAATARFNRPHGISVSSDGTVYVADAQNHIIRKIRPDGFVTTLAGKALAAGAIDGPGSMARFASPYAVCSDAKGNVYVADRNNNAIRKITPEGVVSTLAGQLRGEGHQDGKGSEATFASPRGIVCDDKGYLYVADYDSSLIRRVSPDGTVITLAGKADETGSADGPGPESRFKNPHGIALDTKGRLYIADSENNLIRMITIDSK
jgi:DNA-binding beta-propeller fold protein YncE